MTIILIINESILLTFWNKLLYMHIIVNINRFEIQKLIIFNILITINILYECFKINRDLIFNKIYFILISKLFKKLIYIMKFKLFYNNKLEIIAI